MCLSHFTAVPHLLSICDWGSSMKYLSRFERERGSSRSTFSFNRGYLKIVDLNVTYFMNLGTFTLKSFLFSFLQGECRIIITKMLSICRHPSRIWGNGQNSPFPATPRTLCGTSRPRTHIFTTFYLHLRLLFALNVVTFPILYAAWLCNDKSDMVCRRIKAYKVIYKLISFEILYMCNVQNAFTIFPTLGWEHVHGNI